ncbi:hypothetical protein, partial [Blautia sp. AF19-13LB]|uniref:hypothetical protein n=1 Tax=Blautia sp. AF19-13LB TaxID=2292962 RepID=UPI000FF2727E
FELLCCSLDQQLVYFIKLIRFCQELFSGFLKQFFQPAAATRLRTRFFCFKETLLHQLSLTA